MGPIYTVRETVLFQGLVTALLTERERTELIDALAVNPLVGDVIPGAGGLRKVRWRRDGMGKSGGVRVIYFNRLASGEVVLLWIYPRLFIGAWDGSECSCEAVRPRLRSL